jgi:mRNA interferase MazF
VPEISYPRQGEIYLIRALKAVGDTKKRPAVVVSLNIRNQFSRSVLVVPFSSDIASGVTPTRILIPQGEGGLNQDSLALCDNLSAIRQLNLERGPYGAITPQSLERIQRGIQIAIGIFIP